MKKDGLSCQLDVDVFNQPCDGFGKKKKCCKKYKKKGFACKKCPKF